MIQPKALILLSIALVGCTGSDREELETWMKNEEAQLVGRVEPLPPVVPYEPFDYQAADLTDPFSLAKMRVAKRAVPDAVKRPANYVPEPLEAYDLEKLVMKGTLMKKGQMTALIQTPDSSMFAVHAGSKMGQNFGVVTKITESGVTLKETVEESSGEWVERTTTLPLDEQEQAK